jgi:predicted secreted protein
MKRVLAPLALTATVLLLPATADAKQITVGAKSNGKTITAAEGDKVRVKLTETPGTGYGWRITTKPARAVLKFRRDLIKGRPNPGDTPSVGGPADHYFAWTAKGMGTTTLKIRLFPPGVNTKPGKTYKLTVRVN